MWAKPFKTVSHDRTPLTEILYAMVIYGKISMAP